MQSSNGYPAMERLGADLPKVAYATCRRMLVHLEAAGLSPEFMHKPFVAISMGEIGKQSRISGGAYGSAITFAAAPSNDGQSVTAPGQIKAAELHKRICETYGCSV
jgi:3-dehydroquinate dehydratase-1